MVGSASIFICTFFISWGHVSCKEDIRMFPSNFKFGASTAAYQIEGGWNEDGKGLSIWDVATHLDPSPIEDKSTGDVAANSYHLYERDVEMAKELGLDFYRFSIAWTRILPNGFPDKINQAGVEYYDNLINELLANNIEPFATMYHWDLPENLQKLGGWSNPDIATWYHDYAKVLFDKFGDRVKKWITINEPKQICYEGYGSDAKSPFLNITGIGDYLCAKNVLLAHAKAYHLYNDGYRKIQNGSIGISISCTWYEPFSDAADDQQAALDARQFDWGQYAHPIFSNAGGFPHELEHNVGHKSAEQGYPRSRLPDLSATEVALIRGSSDFFGVNSYTTKMAYRDASLEGMYATPSYMDDMGAVLVKDQTWPQAQSSWLQMVPWGFYKLLIDIKEQYGNPPVIITENGWSTGLGLQDESRVLYYRSYLNMLLDAVDEGCDIQGYTAWSLMDNFEWKHGYTILGTCFLCILYLYHKEIQGKVATDNYTLAELNLKPNLKIMMMGSLEEAIQGAQTKPEGGDDVVNDLDIEEEEVDVENQEVYLAKINKRVRDYKINVLNEPRPDKKLLVLDIDYTLFDHRSVAETGYELMRPFLHEFLTSAYEDYDIVIWSATGMKWIEEKMRLLGVSTHQDYKIMFYLDYLAMITVHTAKYGTIDVKPLGVIWGKYPQYSSKNTIMFDDIRRNFIMNPKSGLKIRPFRQAHLNRDRDRELLHLSTYLRDIAQYCEDFDTLNHKKWEKYKPDKKHHASKRKAEDSAPGTPKE